VSAAVVCAGSCASNRPVNMTSDRGLIELSLTSSMSRTSSSTSSSKSSVQFLCQWLIQPAASDYAVVLQFLSLRLFASTASPSRSSKAKSTCSDNFVEIRVGKNLVGCFRLLSEDVADLTRFP